MEEPLSFAILALAALVVGIVALTKLAALKARIEELERRLRPNETATPKPVPATSAVPPPLPAYVTQPHPATSGAPVQPALSRKPGPAFNWESILGVKLFAWIGGFALFLGVVFFVKYAFENNWITPAMRIVAGAIVGIALVIIALLPRVRRYRIPAQSLCATGILILYADTYAAHAFYGLIPLTSTTALMWIVTAVALVLASYLEVQTVAWLGMIGGFVTPFLFWRSYQNGWAIFAYIVVLDCASAAVATLKRWMYLILVAAIGSVIVQYGWWAYVSGLHFGTLTYTEPSWFVFFGTEFLFLLICIALGRSRLNDSWTIAAVAVAGALALFMASPAKELYGWYPGNWNWGVLKFPVAVAVLLAVVGIRPRDDRISKTLAVVVAGTLFLAAVGEWLVCASVFGEFGISFPCGAAVWHISIFLLFVLVPYVYRTQSTWPWAIAAVAAPLHFFFVNWWLDDKTINYLGLSTQYGACIPHTWLWLPTLAFALPAAFGVWYLVKKEHVALASGNSRLASQGAAVLAFVSLVFPVQFHREWITLGWTLEGLALILLFRWIPNRRLRAAGLIVLAAAFVRLALNPAVLSYHPRTHVPIWNWYLYAYGIATICLFLGAFWFGEAKERDYERAASPLLYSLSGIVLFLLMNIEIADYFSIGPTLTFSFNGNFARDMTYTIAWSLFAFCLLVLGIARNARAVRFVGIALLLVAFAKLFLHDLDSLNQLYRIGTFIAVAVIAIVASFIYQRFLLPRTKA